MTTAMFNDSQWSPEGLIGEPLPEHARFIFIAVGIMYIMAGLVGNVVIIVTVLTNKVMHNPHYYFIINLAIADLTIIAYIVPWTVAGLILNYYPVNSWSLCVFNGVVIVVGYLASLLTLMVISINRYLNICHRDLFATIFSRKIMSSLIYCFVIWGLALLSCMPALVGWTRFHFDVKTHYCGYDRTYNFYYTLYLMLSSIGVPVAIVLACNLGLWRFIRNASMKIHHFKIGHATDGLSAVTVSSSITPFKVTADANPIHSSDKSIGEQGVYNNQDEGKSGNKLNEQLLNTDHAYKLSTKQQPGTSSALTSESQSLQAQQGESISTSTKSSMKKSLDGPTTKKLISPEELSLIKSLFVVFVCFAVLMTPYMMACLLDTSDRWPSVVHLTCSYTSFTNSCINWVIYGVMNKNFKRAYKKLFFCVFFRKNTMSKNNSLNTRSQIQDNCSDNN